MQWRQTRVWLVPYSRMCHLLLILCYFWTELTFCYFVVAVHLFGRPIHIKISTIQCIRRSAQSANQHNSVYPQFSIVRIVAAFRSTHIFSLYSSYSILCSKTWKFSYVSFMWTPWTGGIKENLSPLCSNTACKLTLDESAKTLLSQNVCSSSNSSVNCWMLFQYNRSPPNFDVNRFDFHRAVHRNIFL